MCRRITICSVLSGDEQRGYVRGSEPLPLHRKERAQGTERTVTRSGQSSYDLGGLETGNRSFSQN